MNTNYSVKSIGKGFRLELKTTTYLVAVVTTQIRRITTSIIYSDLKKASNAERSVDERFTKRSLAWNASPPCHKIASSSVRALPSCKKLLWPFTVEVSPIPQSAGVRHSFR